MDRHYLPSNNVLYLTSVEQEARYSDVSQETEGLQGTQEAEPARLPGEKAW